MAPPFYFSIKEMRANETSPRVTSEGRWKPPKPLGSNVPSPTESWYQYDEANPEIYQERLSLPTRRTSYQAVFRRANQQQALPDLYKSVSIYHSLGYFWLVEYDATQEQVSNGSHARSSRSRSGSSVDGEEKPDWEPINFREQRPNRVSYICRRGTHDNLIVKRRNQCWTEKILTDAYRPQNVTDNRNHGGLVGELPLLIGLVHLALPEREAADFLRFVPRSGPWQVIDRMGRGHGWQDKRGVVVSVYTNPSGSSHDDLKNFEFGGNGKIFD